jgi:hypothetical protein
MQAAVWHIVPYVRRGSPGKTHKKQINKNVKKLHTGLERMTLIQTASLLEIQIAESTYNRILIL